MDEPPRPLADILAVLLGEDLEEPLHRAVVLPAAQVLPEGDRLADRERHHDRARHADAESERGQDESDRHRPAALAGRGELHHHGFEEVGERDRDEQRDRHRPHGVADVDRPGHDRDEQEIADRLEVPEMGGSEVVP